MLEKLQRAFDEISTDGKISVELEFHEVSTLLSLVKANEVYEKSIAENMFKGFEKNGYTPFLDHIKSKRDL